MMMMATAPSSPLKHRPVAASSNFTKMAETDQRWHTATQLPRAASYTYIPALADTGANQLQQHQQQMKDDEIRRTKSKSRKLEKNHANRRRSEEVNRRQGQDVGQDSPKSETKKQGRWSQRVVLRSKTSKKANGGPTPPGQSNGAVGKVANEDGKAQGPSEGSKGSSEESQTSRSRSPSPSEKTEPAITRHDSDDTVLQDGRPTPIKRSSSSPPPTPNEVTKVPQTTARPRRLSMRQSVLGRRGVRPLSSIFKGSTPSPDRSSEALPQLHVSLSTDRLPVLAQSTPLEKRPPLPRAMSSDSLRSLGGRVGPRRKDELWGAFRTLDNEFHKFQSKTSALKAQVVRHALLPWLKNHAQHPSNLNLRPEDLDRRTMILNKWWIALLEMIDGGSSYTVSGTDRPIILDGITGIMTRPEWRTLPASDRRTQQAALGHSHSSMSLESTGSDFLSESTYHNTRNLFTSNLLTQTSIVVEQLSLRQAAASLVTFSAKTLAYSFYFCPGVAEVLVRLWATPSSNIRHMAAEWDLLGPGPTNDLDVLFSEFPKHLSTLRFTSYASTVRHLRRPPAMMLTIRNINWHGHWTTRWCGRESDLLFVFIKQWHLLLEDFLPVSITARDRARSPALVLVYGQLMNVLQSTFQSTGGLGSSMTSAINSYTPASTFDDVLANADASAAALPRPATNVARQMAENRLVMLMRDVLSGRPLGRELASRTFATCAVKLLQATARRISKFDHDACFTLCDFLEEVMYILDRYQAANSSLPDIIDWTFWLEVCKQMSENENVMTEIRLFSFLYSIWGIWTQDPGRKNELCRNWLLTRETFDRFFFHWCPMTRAYYMRLLCWRVARIPSVSPSTMDINILQCLSWRLRDSWSKFKLWCEVTKDEQDHHPPAFRPSNPAPGRRLVIIPDDSQIPVSQFLSFDDLTRPTSPAFSTRSDPFLSPFREDAPNLHTTNDSNSSSNSSKPSESNGRRRWDILRTLRGLGNFGNNNSNDSNKSNKDDSSSSINPPATTQVTLLRSNNRLSIIPGTRASTTEDLGYWPNQLAPPTPANVRATFKFSLETAERRPMVQLRELVPRLPTPIWLALPQAGKAACMTSQGPPVSSSDETSTTSKQQRYMGRALAEWSMLVKEFEMFVEHRLVEGVLDPRMVETPLLSVDWFGKLEPRRRI